MRQPIVIVGTPRSGTSLTAGLFAQNGVWVGPCRSGDKNNRRGYFESLPFKDALIRHCGRIVHAGKLAPHIPDWSDIARDILERNEYPGGPWLVKHSAMYWPVWHEFDPVWVCCRRDPMAIARSGRASGYLTRIEAIEPHIEEMVRLRDDHGAHEVWPERFTQGDFSGLIPAFEEAGVAFDRSVAEAFVDPGLWHQW